MKKSEMIIALMASLGAGAATFYTMSKSDQPLDKAMQSVTPLLNNMTNSGSSNNGNAGSPAGQNFNQHNNNNYHQPSETMGPYGMS